MASALLLASPSAHAVSAVRASLLAGSTISAATLTSGSTASVPESLPMQGRFEFGSIRKDRSAELMLFGQLYSGAYVAPTGFTLNKTTHRTITYGLISRFEFGRLSFSASGAMSNRDLVSGITSSTITFSNFPVYETEARAGIRILEQGRNALKVGGVYGVLIGNSSTAATKLTSGSLFGGTGELSLSPKFLDGGSVAFQYESISQTFKHAGGIHKQSESRLGVQILWPFQKLKTPNYSEGE